MLELGIYGGTFAPVHNGHIAAARAFFEKAHLDRLLIMPALIPPHKQLDFSDDPHDRYNMLKLAFENEKQFGDRLIISDYELNSPPPSYTVNTLKHFAKDDTHLTFLCGTDMFLTLDTWHCPEKIFKLARIALMMREENASKEILKRVKEKKEEYLNRFNADILVIHAPAIEISSSKIRNGSDELRKKYLPQSVFDYISEKKLYEPQNDDPEEALSKLREKVSEYISGKRLDHTYSVENEIKALCKLFSLSEEETFELRCAALLHDITKEKSLAEQIELCDKYEIPYSKLELKSPKVLHAMTAPAIVKRDFPEYARENILSAIRFHTTGRANMTLGEKLLYLADYIEPTRTFPDCIKLRKEFYKLASPTETHLNDILLLSFKMTVTDLEKEGHPIHPDTISAMNFLSSL